VNHREKSGSLTPFFDEAIVSPYCTLSTWFLKTLPGSSNSFWNHPAMNGSLTPFLDEAMVSSYCILSKWFPQPHSWATKGFHEPSHNKHFLDTIPQQEHGLPIPSAVPMVPENPSQDFSGFLGTTKC
jgi:hypothetical protein